MIGGSQNKSKYRKASNHYKKVLEAGKVLHANKTRDPFISQKLGSCEFQGIAYNVFNKGQCTITPLFNGSGVLYSVSDKIPFTLKMVPKVIIDLDSSYPRCLVLTAFQWYF